MEGAEAKVDWDDVPNLAMMGIVLLRASQVSE